MEKNMGKTDTRMRIIAAAIILLLYLFEIISGTAAAILLVIAAVFVVTSVFGVCPLYKLFGISTCKTPR